jgi:hypothetical protein
VKHHELFSAKAGKLCLTVNYLREVADLMFDIYFAADDAALQALADQCAWLYPAIWMAPDQRSANEVLAQAREAGMRLSTWHSFDIKLGNEGVRWEILNRNVTEGQAIVLGARTEDEYHDAVDWVNQVTMPLRG